MKTHLESNSNYWYHYLLNRSPSEIEQVIHEHFISIRDKSVHIDIYEPDTSQSIKSNIIFIHGTSIYGRFYSEFCFEMCKRNYRVISPDMPGHGLTEGQRGDFTMNSAVSTLNELVKFIQKEYTEPITMIGSSLGGITTLYAAIAKLPIKVAICHNAAIFSENAYKHIISVKGIFKILLPFVPLLERMFPKIRISVLNYLPKEKLANNSRGFKLYDLFTKDPLLVEKYTLTALKAQMSEAPIDSLEGVSIPILFVNGENDLLFKIEYMRSLYERIQSKDKEFLILENQAHLIFQEQPQLVAEKIHPFLEKYI